MMTTMTSRLGIRRASISEREYTSQSLESVAHERIIQLYSNAVISLVSNCHLQCKFSCYINCNLLIDRCVTELVELLVIDN